MWQTSPEEAGRTVFQIGTCSAQHALLAAQTVYVIDYSRLIVWKIKSLKTLQFPMNIVVETQLLSTLIWVTYCDFLSFISMGSS